MKKKIAPRDQTKELNRARIEFLKRNPDEMKRIENLIERNDKKRDEVTTQLASFFGDCDPTLKECWDFFLREYPFDGEYKKKDEELTVYPAANAGWPFLDFAMDNAHRVLLGEKSIHHMDRDELSEKFLDYLCKNARWIFTEMTNGRPLKHLFVGIDLTRTKEAILAEVAELISLHQLRTGVSDMERKRLKWLPIVDELLQVWDLWSQAGQKPWQRTMPAIARKVGRKTSTVKAQWRMAYEMIKNEPYDPSVKYSTEEKRRTADELCANCPHGARCYKSGDWYPCAEYRDLAGKDRSIKTIEYKEGISSD